MNTQEQIELLSNLMLAPSRKQDVAVQLNQLGESQRSLLASFADAHHVLVRSLEAIAAAPACGKNADLSSWARETSVSERARIEEAVAGLWLVCQELERAGCPVVVMKSLDHWPDIGSDFDLLTTADRGMVTRVLQSKFEVASKPRSWGDRLADKCNFRFADLTVSVEIHHRRLGQTGEHIRLAQRFIERRMPAGFAGRTLLIPAPEERVIAASLQRMYRHFYIRLCDIVNTAALLESRSINFRELRASADLGGVWPGVATFLRVVTEYVKRYREFEVELPQEVLSASLFGAAEVVARGKWLRVPLYPRAVQLYTRQLRHTAWRADLPATFRLGLLPPLASAAKLAYKMTGDHTGIW
jgi:hypothetical protein